MDSNRGLGVPCNQRCCNAVRAVGKGDWRASWRAHATKGIRTSSSGVETVAADLPVGQEQEWEIAKRIVSTDRFQKLPTKFEVHEWAIMQDFSRSMELDRVREDLLRAVHGAGAFRDFKATLRRHHIESAWYAFRAEALRQIALNWCEENHIAWE